MSYDIKVEKKEHNYIYIFILDEEITFFFLTESLSLSPFPLLANLIVHRYILCIVKKTYCFVIFLRSQAYYEKYLQHCLIETQPVRTVAHRLFIKSLQMNGKKQVEQREINCDVLFLLLLEKSVKSRCGNLIGKTDTLKRKKNSKEMI